MKTTKCSSGDTSSIHPYLRLLVGQDVMTATIKRIKGHLPKITLKHRVL